MTSSEFNTKDLDTQYDIVSEGELLEVREVYKYRIALYHTHNFYAELFYDMKANEITRIKALESETDWHGYLESVNIEGLI